MLQGARSGKWRNYRPNVNVSFHFTQIFRIKSFYKIFFNHLRASDNTTSPTQGRLNNPSDAWCFSYESISSEKVFFTVDLGKLHMVY